MLDLVHFRPEKGGQPKLVVKSQVERERERETIGELERTWAALVNQVQQDDHDLRRLKKEVDHQRKLLNSLASGRGDRSLEEIRHLAKDLKLQLKQLEQNANDFETEFLKKVSAFGNIVTMGTAEEICGSIKVDLLALSSYEKEQILSVQLNRWLGTFASNAFAVPICDGDPLALLRMKWLNESGDLPVIYVSDDDNRRLHILCKGESETSKYTTLCACSLFGSLLHSQVREMVTKLCSSERLEVSWAYAIEFYSKETLLLQIANTTDFLSREAGIRSGPKRQKSIHEQKKFVHIVTVVLHNIAFWQPLVKRFSPESNLNRSLTMAPRSETLKALECQDYMNNQSVSIGHELDGEQCGVLSVVDLEHMELQLRRTSFVGGATPSSRDVFLYRLFQGLTIPCPSVQYPSVSRWARTMNTIPSPSSSQD